MRRRKRGRRRKKKKSRKETKKKKVFKERRGRKESDACASLAKTILTRRVSFLFLSLSSRPSVSKEVLKDNIWNSKHREKEEVYNKASPSALQFGIKKQKIIGKSNGQKKKKATTAMMLMHQFRFLTPPCFSFDIACRLI